MEIFLRPACQADAPDIVSIISASLCEMGRQAYAEHPAFIQDLVSKQSTDSVMPWFGRADLYVTLAVAKPQCVVGMSRMNGQGRISHVFVLPEYMGLGIGAQLLMDLIVKGDAAQIPRLNVLSSLNARPFYEKHGFIWDKEFPADPKGLFVPLVKELG